jgi:hypothetical protein
MTTSGALAARPGEEELASRAEAASATASARSAFARFPSRGILGMVRGGHRTLPEQGWIVY